MFKKHVLPKKNVATFFCVTIPGDFDQGFYPDEVTASVDGALPTDGLAGHFGFDDWGRWNSWFLGV